MHRIPALETAPVRRRVNGPESFTPDGRYLLGEAPECRNFFVAAGFNSIGIASGAGAGRAVAEWVVGGGGAATHNAHWIPRPPRDPRGLLTDVTPSPAGPGGTGPRARAALARLAAARA